MSGDTTYGICIDGSYLPLIEQAKKFSNISNVYCFAFFDCCRNRIKLSKGGKKKGSLFILYSALENK